MKNRSQLRRAACFAIPAVLCAAAGSASGDIIISNLASVSGSGTVFGTCASTIFKAGGFTLDSSMNYMLDLVQLDMDYDYSGGGELGTYAIWEGNGAPATLVVTLDPVDRLVGAGIFGFKPSSPTALEGGKTYWVYLTEATPPTGCMLWVGGDAEPSGIARSAGYNFNGNPSSYFNKYEVQGTPASACPCACDFDTSTGPGVCDIFDFLAFQDAFVGGEACACDIDTSTGPGVCDIFDFLAFQDEFVSGCP